MDGRTDRAFYRGAMAHLKTNEITKSEDNKEDDKDDNEEDDEDDRNKDKDDHNENDNDKDAHIRDNHDIHDKTIMTKKIMTDNHDRQRC